MARYNAPRIIAVLLAAVIFALYACSDASLFAPPRAASLVGPTCYGRTATIYPGNPGSGNIAANAFGGLNITGTAGADVIVGSSGPDTIVALDGDDRVCAAGGNDAVAGGAGADRMDGEAGFDELDYSASPDRVRVTLVNGRGHLGDAEDDRSLNFENLKGSSFDDILTGNNGPNALTGGAGNDVIRPGLGADEIDGGSDLDRVQYAETSGAVHVDLLTGRGLYNEADGDTYAGIEDLVGTAAADTLIGDNTDNTLIGKAGNDVLIGNGGADRLFGQENDDDLSGGPGNDNLRGGAGDNDVDGGPDLDTSNSESCMDVIVNVERIKGDCTFGPLDHFLIEAPGGGAIGDQSSGTSFAIMVSARDASNHVITNFAGTVALSYTGAASGGLGNSPAFVKGVLLQHYVSISAEGSIQIQVSGSGETGTSNTFSVSERPFAANDQAGYASAPGTPFHTAYQADLVIATSSPQNLLANDLRGYPAANITSFGAIQCNDGAGTMHVAAGTVTTNTAGSTADMSAIPGCGASTLTVNADGSVTYHPSAAYTGLMSFVYRITNVAGTADGNVTFAVGIRPVAHTDTYSGAIIDGLTLNTAVGTPFSVGSNDTGDNLSFGVLSTTEGALAFNADGTFTYTSRFNTSPGGEPAPATYSATNGFGASNAQLQFLISDKRIWFVDGSVTTTGNGSQAAPFKNLTDIDNSGVSHMPQVGDVIFVVQNPAPYDNYGSGVFKLRGLQKLIGQDASASVAAITGWTVPAQQTMPATLPLDSVHVRIDQSGIELNVSNTLRGFSIGPNGLGITGTSFGTLTLGGDVAIAVNGAAVSLASGTINGNFASVSASSTGSLHLYNVAGTTNFGTGTISGTNDVVSINGASGLTFRYDGAIIGTGNTVNLSGSSNVTLNGAISQTGGAGSLVEITNHSGSVAFGAALSADSSGVEVESSSGTYTFGDITLSNGGIELDDNTGATFSFTGNLDLEAFTAATGGTVSVTGANNTLSTSRANVVALYLSDVTIASSNVTFKRIDSSGGFAGMYLLNTGAQGGVIVTGSGTSGSGGSITNSTGADGGPGGTGVYMQHANNVKLHHMTISNHSNYAIHGIGVTGFTLDSSTVGGTNGDNGTDETSIRLDSVAGIDSLTNNSISGGRNHNLNITNTTGAPVLGGLVVRGNTFGFVGTGDGITLASTVGSLTAQVSRNTITSWTTQAVNVSVSGTATVQLVADSNTISQSHMGADSDAGNFMLTGGALTYSLTGNTMQGAYGPAIGVQKSANFAGQMRGTIDGNAIGVSGLTNSGSSGSNAIWLQHYGNGTSTVSITNNVIRQVDGAVAIQVTAADAAGGGGSGVLNATIIGNDIQEGGSVVNPGRRGVLVQVGQVSGDAHQACVDIGGGTAALQNLVTNFGANSVAVGQLENTLMQLPGYLGHAYDTAAVEAYLQGRNSAVGQGVTTNTGDGFANTTPAGSACPR